MEKYVLFLCIVAYYLYRIKMDRIIDSEMDKQIKEQRLFKKIQYWVNEKEINVPHHIYYKHMLNLYDRNDITDDVIREESLHILDQTLETSNKMLVVDLKDIKAARSFLLDQWAYFVRWN